METKQNIESFEFEEFLKSFGFALNQVSLYTIKHRMAKDAIERSYNALSNIISSAQCLDLSISDDNKTVILNGTVIELSLIHI